MPYKIHVFDSRPAANKVTFDQGGLLIPDNPSEEQLSLILYGTDLQNIGYIDNRTSDATTTYEKSVTVGFAFTATQSITTEVAAEFDIVFAKATVSISLTLTFSEEWSKSTTETYSFQVGPGKEAFTYQGYVRSQILRHQLSDDSYSWGSLGTLYTPALVTRNQRI
ncbi:hypothetical protein [Streptomyces sp. UNOB3_S3]|uniref:hypothetical protein n=1 Tax=Streptomyces sp. UNOB3_S3 TaxID=2871682 RepID=UPI001E5CA0FC|nr:hypothetical protein [Streptomyces sp. UNOB3_S3]MCC3775144.1 hypothetical protein [Streptomyces sp. UNOB3_S3]